MTEKDVAAAEERWNKDKDLIKRRNTIIKERRALRQEIRFKTTTTKLLMAFLFINCTVIELFTMRVIDRELDLCAVTGLAPDLTPLVTLISTVVGEVIAFAVYAIKSTKENTKNGIVFETAMREDTPQG